MQILYYLCDSFLSHQLDLGISQYSSLSFSLFSFLSFPTLLLTIPVSFPLSSKNGNSLKLQLLISTWQMDNFLWISHGTSALSHLILISHTYLHTSTFPTVTPAVRPAAAVTLEIFLSNRWITLILSQQQPPPTVAPDVYQERKSRSFVAKGKAVIAHYIITF